VSIIQRIEIRQYGAEAAERAIDATNDALDETGRAGARASAGLDRASASARDSGRDAGGAGGLWATFKTTISGANEGVGKITAGFQLLGGALGALLGGGVIGGAVTAAITAFGQLRDIITDEEGRLRDNVEAVHLLKDAYKDFARQLLDVAKSAEEMHRAALGGANAYASELGVPRASLSAAGFLAGADQGEAAFVRQKERNRLEQELLNIRQSIIAAEKQAVDQGLPSFRRDQARGMLIDLRARRDALGAQYDALREAIQPPAYSASGSQKATPAPVGGTFFGLDRTAFSVYQGAMQGPAFGPADDPSARRLAAYQEKDLGAPFSAATAAIEAFRDAQDRAFDLERAGQFFDVVNASVDQFGQGVTQSAANAILFGTSFSKGVNTAMKALAAQAAAQALWEGAQAVGALAMGRPDAAALHWEAAALYTGVAAIAALGAAASGGLRSGGGRRGGAGAGGGAAEVGPDRSQPTVFAPTIIVGLDGEPIYRGMHRYNDTLEGSRAQRRFAVAA